MQKNGAKMLIYGIMAAIFDKGIATNDKRIAYIIIHSVVILYYLFDMYGKIITIYAQKPYLSDVLCSFFLDKYMRPCYNYSNK